MGYFAHPTAVIDNASIGDGTKIWHFSHVSDGAEIGKNCVIGQNVFIGKNVKIGSNCKIQNGVNVFEGVFIDDAVFIGPCTTFTNVKHPRAFFNQKHNFQSTNVARGVTIGANCTIICGISIGEYAIIGAGSVVTKSVEPSWLVYGNPATHKGHVGFLANEL